jgi:cytochrome c2
MKKHFVTLAGFAVVGLVLAAGVGAEAAGKGPTPAQQAALASCQGCHDITPAKNKLVGPALYGAYGKKPSIGGVPFAKWDKASLDKFLADPSKVKPDTAMPVNVPDAKERAAVIEALKGLK